MVADIIRVDKDNQRQLYDYCSKYAIEHDSSNVPGRDFDLSEEHPSYLQMENDQAVGAVSLMRTKRFLSVGKGRFSIFHANNGDLAVYKKLLEAILPHIDDLQNVFMFIPEKKRSFGRNSKRAWIRD